jgi:hypothetical protein
MPRQGTDRQAKPQPALTHGAASGALDQGAAASRADCSNSLPEASAPAHRSGLEVATRDFDDGSARVWNPTATTSGMRSMLSDMCAQDCKGRGRRRIMASCLSSGLDAPDASAGIELAAAQCPDSLGQSVSGRLDSREVRTAVPSKRFAAPFCTSEQMQSGVGATKCTARLSQTGRPLGCEARVRSHQEANHFHERHAAKLAQASVIH